VSREIRAKGLPWSRLRRFFADRRPISLRDAGALLGLDRSAIAESLDLVAVPEPERGIPWTEAAALVCQTLTPAELDALLGRTSAFPALLRVSRVEWRIPMYLMVALEHLVADERSTNPAARRLTVEACVARRLDLTLDSDLLARLCLEPAFRNAFHFPEDAI